MLKKSDTPDKAAIETVGRSNLIFEISVSRRISPNPADTADMIEYYEKYSSVDAIILIDPPATVLPPHETPIISLGSRAHNADVTLCLDYMTALKSALTDFKAAGISHIGFIGEPHTVTKLSAFKSAVSEIYGFTEEKYISVSDLRFEKGGCAAARAFYSHGALPEAIICAYDDMALGAMRFFHDNGISVPDDIKVIGMDNILHSEYFVPSLSTIDYMNEEIAKTATESVFELLDGKMPAEIHNFSARLITRESSQI